MICFWKDSNGFPDAGCFFGFFFLFLILNQRFKYSRNHLACPDLEAIYYEQYHFTDGWRDLPIVTQLGNGWNRTAWSCCFDTYNIKILQFALIIVFTPRNRYELSVFYLVYNINCWWNEHKIKLVTAKLQMERFSRIVFFTKFDLQIWSRKIEPGINCSIKENVKRKIIPHKSLIRTKIDQWIKSLP